MVVNMKLKKINKILSLLLCGLSTTGEFKVEALKNNNPNNIKLNDVKSNNVKLNDFESNDVKADSRNWVLENPKSSIAIVILSIAASGVIYKSVSYMLQKYKFVKVLDGEKADAKDNKENRYVDSDKSGLLNTSKKSDTKNYEEKNYVDSDKSKLLSTNEDSNTKNAEVKACVNSEKSKLLNAEEKFVFGQYLGNGVQGRVYLCVNKETGEKVAIKKISKICQYPEQKVLVEISVRNELLAMNKLRVPDLSPYITRPIEYYEDDDALYLVYEYVEDYFNNWIAELSTKQKNERIKFVFEIARQVISGYIWFRNHNLYHDDFKIEGNTRNLNFINPDFQENIRDSNVLISRDAKGLPILKILDFGFLTERKMEIENVKRDICKTLLRIERFILKKGDSPIIASNGEAFDSVLDEFFVKFGLDIYNVNRVGTENKALFNDFSEALKYLEDKISKIN